MMKKNLLLLAASYFCGVTVFFSNVTIINLIAKQIATDGNLEQSLSTLPFGFLISFTALVFAPAGVAMNKFGQKKVFIFAAFLGLIGGIVCIGGLLLLQPVAALSLSTFGVALQGCAYGVVNFYRHVAVLMGGMDDGVKSWCVAIVITSGALAGIVGPGIPIVCRLAFPSRSYIAVYVSVIVIYIFHVIFLYFADVTVTAPQRHNVPVSNSKPRPLWKIIIKFKYIHACISGTVSNGLMMMIMGMTPILLIDQINLIYLSIVVQLHAVSMFVPSFFTSKLIGKFGAMVITSVGYFVGALGAALYLINDAEIWHVYAWRTVSLILIGFGWNFTFVSSTTLLANCYNSNEKHKAQAFNDTCLFGFGGLLSLLCGTFLKTLGLFAILITSVVVYTLLGLLNLIYGFRDPLRRVIRAPFNSFKPSASEYPLKET